MYMGFSVPRCLAKMNAGGSMHNSLGIFAATMTIVAASLAACSDDAAQNADVQADGGNGQPGNTDGGGTHDSGNESPGAGLGPGPYTIAYAGTEVGIDMRPIAHGKATFDGQKLLSYEASDEERPELGTNQVNEAAADAFVAIGRWSGGKTSGKFYEIAGAGVFDLPANGGFHYAIGNFLDPLPAAGTFTYAELAKTAATVSDGSVAPGTISGNVAVSFAGPSTKIGFSLTLDIPGDATYTLATTGGTDDVSTTEAMMMTGSAKGAFSASLELTNQGAACGGSCAGAVYGFVAGPDAERIALVAHVYSGSGGSPKSVAGAIVFKK